MNNLMIGGKDYTALANGSLQLAELERLPNVRERHWAAARRWMAMADLVQRLADTRAWDCVTREVARTARRGVEAPQRC